MAGQASCEFSAHEMAWINMMSGQIRWIKSVDEHHLTDGLDLYGGRSGKM